MSQFHCKFCNRPMAVNFLEYRSNSFCNQCFDERAASKPIVKSRLNTFEFMGDVIPLFEIGPIKKAKRNLHK